MAASSSFFSSNFALQSKTPAPHRTSLPLRRTSAVRFSSRPRPTPIAARSLADGSNEANGNSGNLHGGGGGGGEGDLSGKRNKEEALSALVEMGRGTETLPADLAAAMEEGRIPGEIVRRFAELEKSAAFRWLMQFAGFKERLLADDLFLAKVAMECGIGIFTKVAANMTVLKRACDFFFRHAAQLSGIPLRIAERSRRDFPLKKSQDAIEELLVSLLRGKIDDFLLLTDSVSWMADEPPLNGNEYANEVIIYLETLVSTAQQILPVPVLRRIIHGVLSHISDKIVGLFLNDSVKRFNANAVTGIDTDLKLFESFADTQSHLLGESEGSGENDLKLALTEARQLVNLLTSNSPENFMNAVIRERSYNKLDHKKVVIVSEKFRASERLFGTFGSRNVKANPKKKSLDNLIKRLKDVN